MDCKLRYELDDSGKIGITLEEFDSLEQMDLFMRQFKDSNSVKESYLDEINKFLKTDAAKGFLKIIKGRDNNGYLRGYTKYNERFVRMPLIYQSAVLNKNECFKRLRVNLHNRKILYYIYNKKPYLLPGYPTLFLRHELCRVLVHYGSDRIFVKEFVSYIEKMKPEEQYFAIRSLAEKCDLLNPPKVECDNIFKIWKTSDKYSLVKTRHYSFGDYSDEEIHEMIMDNKVNLREYAYSEFEMKNIGDLLKEYDLDEIDRNTDYFDNKGKMR